MKKELPILFSTPMVQAILAGRKTITRRIMKYNRDPKYCDREDFLGELQDNPSIWGPCSDFRPASFNEGVIYDMGEEEPMSPCYVDFETKHSKDTIWTACLRCPYGKPGDLLWVRESAAITISSFKAKRTVWYKADNPEIPPRVSFKWKPSIHMPKVAARIWLEVTDIRVERLHDITEEDAKAEGVETLGLYPGYDVSAEGKFEGLWGLINGTKSWNANPWVWVVSFKVLSTTGRPEMIEEHITAYAD